MRGLRKQRGQSLVELTLSFFLIFIILFGVIDFGRLFYFYIAIRDAAQEGVTYASIHPGSNSDIRSRVRGSSDSPLNLDSAQIDISYSGDTCAAEPGNSVTVAVSTNFQFITPVFSVIGIIPLSAEITDTILTPLCS